jgi:diguanylate cyclase (GGDEF)-like protein
MSAFSINNTGPIARVIAGTILTVLLLLAALGSLSIIEFWLAGVLMIVVSSAGGAVGYSIHVKRLEGKNAQMAEFNRVHLATIEALATAIDARDQLGVGHARRVQIYAVKMGELAGLSEPEIDALRTGALLHDIGKLAVPDHILNKPGELTSAEMEKTKIYPSVGASILDKVGFNYPVVPTVRFRHERWDGDGYPLRLAGDAIPITARILSVADEYDTLRCDRPYRVAHSRDAARKIIQAGSGTRFDPAIVNLLIKNLAYLETAAAKEGIGYADSNDESHEQAYVEQIKLANREVFNLYELAIEFGASVNLSETLEMFARKVGEFVPFDTCALYLLDGKKGVANAAHVEGVNAALLSLSRIKIGEGATGYTLKMRETLANGEPDLDFLHTRPDLVEHYTTMASVPLIADGSLVGAITIYSVELEQYEEEHIRLLETITGIAAEAIGKSLQHDEAKTYAMTDPMTGLPNARSLQLQFDKEVARANRGETSFQLLMLDLDGFKAVNDNFGHKIGDELLRGVSKVILAQLRDYDFLARYGGDEFVALVPETETADVVDLCRRIEEAVSSFALKVDGGAVARVGVSLGASGYPKNGETFDQMIIAADKIMYRRKVERKRLNMKTVPIPPAEAPVFIIPGSVTEPIAENLIVELDESHVLASAAIN